MRARLLPLLLLGGSIAANCSSTDQPTTTFSSDVGGAGGYGGAGSGAGEGTSASVASSSSSAASSSSTSSASSSTSASSSSSSSGSMCDFSAPNDCADAVQLSDISGDTGSDVRKVSDSTSKWFKVLVTDQFTLGNSWESYTATLESPPGMDFDLFAYPGDGSSPNCFAAPLQASGIPEALTDKWDDDNGDNDRWIIFEVRYVSGEACGAAAKWTLTVQGHTAG